MMARHAQATHAPGRTGCADLVRPARLRSWARLRCFHERIQHAMQMRYRKFYIIIFLSPGARLGGQQSTAVDFLEIAVRKLVATLGFFALLVIYAEMPFGVIGVAAPLDEFVFLPGGRLVFTPRIAVIGDVLSVSDQALRIVEGPIVELDRHRSPFDPAALINRRWRVLLIGGSGRTSPVPGQLPAPTSLVLRTGARHPG